MIAEPAEEVRKLVLTFEKGTDEEVLAEIAKLPPLADEADERWGTDDYWHAAAFPYLALADVAARRRLRPAVRLLLGRASFGDPGEIMRGLRHRFERIFEPDWKQLGDEYLAMARSGRLGTRLWSMGCLAVLDDPRAVPVYERALREESAEIRWAAEIGLKRMLHPEVIAREAEARGLAAERARQEWLEREAEVDARITDRRCAVCKKPFPPYRRTCKYCGASA